MFHLGSFSLGFVSGLATAKLTPRLRAVGLELMTIGVRVVDGFSMRMAQRREDLEDLLAEARARVRASHEGVSPPEETHAASATGASSSRSQAS
jgi:hypothetical protein